MLLFNFFKKIPFFTISLPRKFIIGVIKELRTVTTLFNIGRRLITMENIYAIIKKGGSLKRYCYKNGYKLEEIISVKDVDTNRVSAALSKHGLKFPSRKDSYRGYYIRVSKGNIFTGIAGYFLNLFTEDSYVSMKIKESFYGGTEVPFSF